MKPARRTPGAAAALAALAMLAPLLAGCDSKWGADGATYTAAALAPVERPVGPVPGPGQATGGDRNPVAHDAQALHDGRALFVRYNCAGCHGGHAGGGMGPSLRDPAWIYGKGPSDIFDSIAEGRAHGMPAWGTRLPQVQIWRLVAYVQSLGTDREPEAPK